MINQRIMLKDNGKLDVGRHLQALIQALIRGRAFFLRALPPSLPPRASEDNTGQQQGHQRRPVGTTVANMCCVVCLLLSSGQTATTMDDKHCTEVYGSLVLLFFQVPGIVPLSFIFLAHWKIDRQGRETTPKPTHTALPTGRDADPFG